MVEKIFPVRKCVGCNEMMPKNMLFRIVKNSNGDIFVDGSMKAAGRGAYVCKNRQCVDLAVKKKGFNRSLKCLVSSELIDKLYEQCEE